MIITAFSVNTQENLILSGSKIFDIAVDMWSANGIFVQLGAATQQHRLGRAKRDQISIKH